MKDRIEKNGDRIVVIGPVYPYKGGISHYTGLLVKALKKKYDVCTISYSMQYPRILFRKDQKDHDNDSFKVEDTEYLLNTALIPNIIKTAGYINSLSPDLVIVQWWHPYFSPCYNILLKRIRSKILLVCHNVFPHERFPFDRALTSSVMKKADFYILHSSKEAEELKSVVPDAKYAVNMHPTYDAFKMEDETDGQVKESGRLLFFGFVRPYKGLDVLLEAMRLLPDVVGLDVVGDFADSSMKYRAMIDSYNLKERVSIREGYVPDREVQKYFSGCDAVVLPYIEATQSGIAQIAYGFGKPVISTTAGGLSEVVLDGKTGVLCRPSDPDDLAAAIKRFYELKGSVDFEANIREDAGRFSWEHMVETIGKLAGIPGSENDG
ncbi:MAG: glycosyltransferase [Lachnospiraceae bacterium]|nr:glycosyltransferase [Lachnospiraceae bacterium]